MPKETASRFFVSANSGNGFYSLYDNVFQNELFEKIFIIHGGPGTGKSTLMRELCKEARALGAEIEEILCSSDPNSLDGVILSYGERRIAVLDGTSPHPRTISVPGAKEELWNLGAFWNADRLAKGYPEIKRLQENKKKSYRQAYSLLSAAEDCHREIHLLRKEELNAPKLCSHIERFVKRLCLYGEPKEKLFRAYSMRGEYVEPSVLAHQKNIVLLCGRLSSAQIYLNYLSKCLARSGIAHTLFHSPLSPSFFDGIRIEEDATLFLWEGFAPTITQGKRMHLDRFFNAKAQSKEKTKRLLSLENSLTGNALSCLSEAGAAHFALEALYGSAMDFERMKKETATWVQQAIALLTAGS